MQRGIWSLRSRLMLLVAATATCALSSCVDLSKPWESVGPMPGTGGRSSDGPFPTDDARDQGGGLDLGGGGAGGAIDASSGIGGAIDVGPGGAGGVGGAGIDAPLAGTGGSIVDADSGLDVPMGTGGGITGGRSGTGGISGTGGRGTTGGGNGGHMGGATGTGGKGTGGSATNSSATGGSGTGGSGTGGSGTGGSGTGGATVPGLVAYYKCNETSGTTLTDSSGNGHHGTLHGTFSFGTGKVGDALILAKSGSGYAALPPSVFAGKKNITIATWVWVTTLDNWSRIFDTGIMESPPLELGPGEGTTYMMLTPKSEHTGNLRFAISTNGFLNEESLNTTSATPVNTWIHVAIVLVEANGGAGWLYINGSPVVQNEATTIQPDDLGAIDYAFIGRSQFTNDPYFDGKIDELRVYDRELSASDIADLVRFTGP